MAYNDERNTSDRVYTRGIEVLELQLMRLIDAVMQLLIQRYIPCQTTGSQHAIIRDLPNAIIACRLKEDGLRGAFYPSSHPQSLIVPDNL